MDKLYIDEKKRILERYFSKKEEIINKHRAGAKGLDTVRELSDITDETIKDLAKISFPDLEEVSFRWLRKKGAMFQIRYRYITCFQV